MAEWWRALLLACCVLGSACAERGGEGGSLRGALEALQRRQRARAEHPHALQRYAQSPDYEEALYELYGSPVQYDDNEYGMESDAIEETIPQKYIVKYLNEEDSLPGNYKGYNLKKKKSHPEQKSSVPHKPLKTAFRERSLDSHVDDRLKELFMDRAEQNEKKKEKAEEQFENDAEYAVLLEKLWSKYKGNHANHLESAPEGVVKLYKERTIKKRQYPNEFNPSAWGPIAFKRKRSPTEEEEDSDVEDYPSALEYPPSSDERLRYTNDNDVGDTESGYNQYEFSQDSNKDMQNEYTIAFQPLDEEKINLPTDGDEYAYDMIEKRFPVTKRSSGPYESMSQRKRSTDSNKKFRAGSGTDPKVMRELSKLFGEPENEIVKSPVKRSSKNEDDSHETKPPIISASPHNGSHDQNVTHIHSDGSHEHQGHSVLHPPNLSGKEEIIDINHGSTDREHPISIKKKSIDWSQYFGVDKRKKKTIPFRNDVNEGLRRQYLETLKHEINHQALSLQQNKVKRDFIINKPLDESEFVIDRASAIAIRSDEKRSVDQHDDSKLDNIDRKLKQVESVIVDEALHMSNIGGDIESKDEQDVKEKTLSRLAAAYSLEKMRKALKEFKISLHSQKDFVKAKPTVDLDESKKKRMAVKKEKAEMAHDKALKTQEADRKVTDEFEDEQGAGHYLNGGADESFSEGYMGGSGRHQAPAAYQGSGGGNGGDSCPVLERIVKRCRGIELLTGDPGQLFLPLCSLHQICYLCGQSAPTTCDLIFLSEADTACGGDAACQQAARGTLMAVRELHDSLADELDGECEAQPCLASALRRRRAWGQVLRR